jgi:hypothetical protein
MDQWWKVRLRLAIVNPASPATVINNLHTGEYTFVLTVVDDKGAVAKDTLFISVINTQRFTEEFKVISKTLQGQKLMFTLPAIQWVCRGSLFITQAE